MPDQDKSPGRYSPPSDAEIDEAQQNLEAALTAYDNEGGGGSPAGDGENPSSQGEGPNSLPELPR